MLKLLLLQVYKHCPFEMSSALVFFAILKWPSDKL